MEENEPIGAPKDGSKTIKWEVQRRLEFIEARLLWEGVLNRSDLTDRFGITTVQASLDLRKYQELAPSNIIYDLQKKYYYATDTFSPYFQQIDPETYLGEMSSFATDILPPFKRSVDLDILREVSKAIRHHEALEIEYQSMSSEDTPLRWVSPHALASDRFRWHMRAYCHKNDDFRDFVLGRVRKIHQRKSSEIDPSQDLAWNQTTTMTLGANPSLSERQRQITQTEYGMQNGQLSITLRKSMVLYLKNTLRLERSIQPEHSHIVLLSETENE